MSPRALLTTLLLLMLINGACMVLIAQRLQVMALHHAAAERALQSQRQLHYSTTK